MNTIDPSPNSSLLAFRKSNPPNYIKIRNTPWETLVTGSGEETILFLHGLAGAYDIWWQQILALRDRFRLIAVTCPPLGNLPSLAEGILAILNHEQVEKTNLVGSSFGGYLAQYLAARYPERLKKAVFSNTYAQPKFIETKFRLVGLVLPFTPERLVMSVLRWGFRTRIYPTSNRSDLTLAYMLEQASGKLSKADIVCRYRNVIERFERTNADRSQTPLMIIESDNDPLIEPGWREDLRAAYPSARVHTLKEGGHFPYLSTPEEYAKLLEEFFGG